MPRASRRSRSLAPEGLALQREGALGARLQARRRTFAAPPSPGATGRSPVADAAARRSRCSCSTARRSATRRGSSRRSSDAIPSRRSIRRIPTSAAGAGDRGVLGRGARPVHTPPGRPPHAADPDLTLGAFFSDLGAPSPCRPGAIPAVRRQWRPRVGIDDASVGVAFEKVRAAGERFREELQPAGISSATASRRRSRAGRAAGAAIAPQQFPYSSPSADTRCGAPARRARRARSSSTGTREMYARWRGPSASAHKSSQCLAVRPVSTAGARRGGSSGPPRAPGMRRRGAAPRARGGRSAETVRRSVSRRGRSSAVARPGPCGPRPRRRAPTPCPPRPRRSGRPGRRRGTGRWPRGGRAARAAAEPSRSAPRRPTRPLRAANRPPGAALGAASPARPRRRSLTRRERQLGEHRAGLRSCRARCASGARPAAPPATSASRVAAAPVAVAVATKIGPRNVRLRAHTGTAVDGEQHAGVGAEVAAEQRRQPRPAARGRARPPEQVRRRRRRPPTPLNATRHHAPSVHRRARLEDPQHVQEALRAAEVGDQQRRRAAPRRRARPCARSRPSAGRRRRRRPARRTPSPRPSRRPRSRPAPPRSTPGALMNGPCDRPASARSRIRRFAAATCPAPARASA